MPARRKAASLKHRTDSSLKKQVEVLTDRQKIREKIPENLQMPETAEAMELNRTAEHSRFKTDYIIDGDRKWI